MKTLKLFVILAVLALANSQNYKSAELAVLAAIKDVLKELLTQSGPRVDLHFCGQKSKVLAEKLLKVKPSEMAVKLFRLGEEENLQIEAPSILLFDKFVHYLNTNITWMSRNGVWHKSLVYAPSSGKLDVVTMMLKFVKGADNEHFIKVVNDTAIDLVTSFRFSPGICNKLHYKTINQFSTKNMKWQNGTFFPEKYENFHNCTIIVERSSATVLSQNIFKILAQQFKFQVVPYNPSNPNESETAYLKAVFFTQHISLINNYEFSSALYSDFITFTVPAGEPYTQFEKMFLMFDKTTWIWIGVTLGAAVVVIFIINFMSRKVQKFVFGRDIQTPTLNVASIFLSGGQYITPGRNFARFMLMMFILWSLIIRTCYQSELYKNLQRDLRKPRIQTVDELNEKNFTLLYHENWSSQFNESIKRFRLSAEVPDSFDDALAAEYTNKITMIIDRKGELAGTYNLTNQVSSIGFLEENTATIHYCLMLNRSMPWNEILFKKIDQTISNGLAQEFEKLENEFRPSSTEDDDTKARQLILDHIEIGLKQCWLDGH